MVVERTSIPLSNLLNADFFETTGEGNTASLAEPDIPLVDAVVGNPPFVKYHRFKGENRERALKGYESAP